MRPVMTLLSLVGLVAGAAWLHGCMACLDKDYPEGLHVELLRSAWDPADYRIEGETEDGPFACTFTIEDLEALRVGTCSPDTVHFGDQGPFLLDILVFDDHPKAAAVTVYRDGVWLGAGAFAPHYQHDEPNGEGCGKQIYAKETLELPAPRECEFTDDCRCVYDDRCGCDTDDVPAWSRFRCQGPTIPDWSCTPHCPCEGTPHLCVSSCDAPYPVLRALCVDGTWSCADPVYPVAQEACLGP